MATNFPTSLDALTNPLGSDSLSNPSHSDQHANANDAIEALQAKVGVNGSAVTSSLTYKVGVLESLNPTSSTSMSKTFAAFHCERNGLVTTTQKYAFGNGSSVNTIVFPFACKLVAATFTATTDNNGTTVVRPWLNTALVGVSTYDMTITSSTSSTVYDFLSSPLSIPANQRFAWECTSQSATVQGGSTITFYVRFD